MKSILLVDDDAIQTDLLREELEMAGYRVSCANSGHRALELLERELVDVVISDICMPHMSGRQLVAAIRRRWRMRPVVILLSGYANLTHAEAKALGAQALLEKPIAFAELDRHIVTLSGHVAVPSGSSSCAVSEEDR